MSHVTVNAVGEIVNMQNAIMQLTEMLSESTAAQPWEETAMVTAKSEHEIRVEFARRLEIACDSCPAVPKLNHGKLDWLARRSGVSRWAVSKWLEGKSKPRMSKIKALAKVLNVDELWLDMGRGKMRPGDDESPDVLSLIDRPALEAVINLTMMAVEERNSKLSGKAVSKVAAQVYIDHVTHKRDYSKEAIHDLMSLLESA